MEDQTVRNVYEDYKFVERSELKKYGFNHSFPIMFNNSNFLCRLGLDHLVGTPALKPYMHGYFLSLKLYDTARIIANPFVYAEHREKLVREKMEKMAETRIRAKKEVGVKVNKALAEKILREAERTKKRDDKKREKKTVLAGDAEDGRKEMDVDMEDATEQPTLLSDPRFAKVFEDPEFEVDEESREYALLNPSSVFQKRNLDKRGKTAVEDEEDESDKMSSDGLGGSSEDEDASDDSDSDDAGGTYCFFGSYHRISRV